jgi:hypothetical protein
MSANDKQVGGEHYRTEGDQQHWDVVYMIFGGDYLLGNASKYMARVGKKGGPVEAIQDLDKAIHYLQKKREMLSANMARKTRDEINSALVGSDLRFRNPAEL